MSSNDSPKREVPFVLRKILNFDEKVSEQFCLLMNKFLPFRSLKTHYKVLEITGNGILWLAGWLAFTWLINSSKLYEMQVNFFIGLILDIIFVGLLKAYFRRRRPAGNPPHGMGTFGPDVYSFPSGHASRAVFIVMFFMFLFPLPIFVFPPLMAWVSSLCISRVLMRRHQILDVVGGIGLGVFECCLLNLLWLGSETSEGLLSFMVDTKYS